MTLLRSYVPNTPNWATSFAPPRASRWNSERLQTSHRATPLLVDHKYARRARNQGLIALSAIALNAAIRGSIFAEPDACLLTKMALTFDGARAFPRFSISSCRCAMDGKFRIAAARDAKQLVDHDFCLAALDGHPSESTSNDEVRHLVIFIFGIADRGAELLVQPLDARSNVHPVAHHGVTQPGRGADIADNDGVAKENPVFTARSTGRQAD